MNQPPDQSVSIAALSEEEEAFLRPLPEAKSFLLLPRRIDQKRAIFESATTTVIKLFRQQKIIVESYTGGMPSAEISENAFSLILPTLFISALYVSQNPELVSVALNILSNYAHDFFKGIQDEKLVKLKLIVRRNGRYKKIVFSGPPEALKDLAGVIKAESESDGGA
jgi:hypothetical protein